MASECTYKKMCPTCNKKHNGLLHGMPENRNREYKPKEGNKQSYVANIHENNTVILPTAMIRVKTTNCIAVQDYNRT